MDTIFSKIINKEIPAEIIFEDDEVIIIKDAFPKAPIHWLAIPKHAYQDIHEAILADDKDIIYKLIKVLDEQAKEKGISSYRLQTNYGKDSGQSVMHLHIHLVAGKVLSE